MRTASGFSIFACLIFNSRLSENKVYKPVGELRPMEKDKQILLHMPVEPYTVNEEVVSIDGGETLRVLKPIKYRPYPYTASCQNWRMLACSLVCFCCDPQ